MLEAALLRQVPAEPPETGEPRRPDGPSPHGPALRAVPGAGAGGEADTGARLRAPTPRLEVAPYDLEAAAALERELGISHVLAQVLVRRGCADRDAAARFLEARERHDPSAFAGIDTAVALI